MGIKCLNILQKKTVILNCNNISQYYRFYCIFNKKKKCKKTNPNFERYCVYVLIQKNIKNFFETIFKDV